MKNGKIKASATKLIALLLLLCTVTLMFSSCGNDVKIEKPEDTNLEYWLWESLNIDECTELYYGGEGVLRDYLAKEYEAVNSPQGNLVAPESAVVYSLTRYPYTDLGVMRIMKIAITDPNVYVWGLNINSTRKEIIDAMNKAGLATDIYIDDEQSIVFACEKNRITFHYGKFIHITANWQTLSHYLK